MKRRFFYLPLIILVIMSGCSFSEAESGLDKIETPSSIYPTIAPSFTHTYSPLSRTSIPYLTATNFIEIEAIDYEAFIGRQFSLPRKLSTRGVLTLDQRFIFSINLVSEESKLSLWFAKRDMVSDILIIPELELNDVISAKYCQLNGYEDPFIITISVMDQESFENRFFENSRIKFAWYADPSSGKITKMSLEGIQCNGEGGFDPNNVIYKFSKYP
jgi:hypothetical protein